MFSITLEAEGLQEIGVILDELSRTGSEYKGAQLAGLPRKDGGVDNAKIMEFLHDSGRKFDDLETNEAEMVAKAAAEEYEKRISDALKRAKNLAKRNARSAAKQLGIKGKQLTSIGNTASSSVTGFNRDEKFSRQTAASVLRAAMRKYMELVEGHINSQTAPGGLTPLKESYRETKLRELGFDTIGKYTGQLLENLDRATAEKGIRLIR